jgi:two-component system sensor histidine kinase TtrS
MPSKPTTVKDSMILTIFLSIIFFLVTGQALADKAEVKIGVLANRGTELCYQEWDSTADYLSQAIPERLFKIVPLPFDKVDAAVANREIDFIIANSAIYVELEMKYFCSRIATLINKSQTGGSTVFGGVIFFRADRQDINALSDLRGKNFVAAHQDSLGGWLAAWGELKKAGLSPFQDFAQLNFAGTQDGVVLAVRDHRADAGTVRTDVLERMSAEGKISLQDFKIIPYKGRGPAYTNFPFLLSTRLYPEWPVARLSQISDELARKVSAALLTLPSDSPAAKSAKVEGWTIPYNYETVHELLRFLQVGPYQQHGKSTISEVMRDHWHILLLAFTLLVMLSTGTVFVINLNFKLKKVGTSLRNELAERQEAEEEIQRLSRRNQLILETVGEGIIGLDIRGRAIFVNPAAAAMTGYAQDELINQEMHQTLHHCKADGSVYPLEECPIEESLKHGTCCRVRDEVLWRKDGTKFPVTYLSAPIIEHGEIVGAVVTFDDITVIKDAELALRESEREREKEHLKTVNLESLGYLAGGIAHDFNNFLTAILGSVSLVIETINKVGDGEELHQILMQAEQATLKARSLAQQLLTFAKGGVPDKQLISLPEIVKQVAGFACVGSSARCEFIFPENLWAVEADPDQLSQLINNLAINAVQAMPGGGIITIIFS